MPKRADLEGLLAEFRPGYVVYIPGASGEIAALQQALVDDPERLSGVTLVSCLLPGINQFDYTSLHPDCSLRTFLLPSNLRPSFEARRVKVLPFAYSSVAAYLSALSPDIAVLHLTPPEDGVCSYGVVADFGPIVAPRAKRRIGVLNHAMPRPMHRATIPLAELDMIVEISEPCGTVTPLAFNSTLEAIGRHVAALIPDQGTVQAGIGQAPSAFWPFLGDHRGLRLWSGMVGDGFFAAYDSGAMTAGGHVAGIAVGTSSLYARLDRCDMIRFTDARETHGPALFEQPRFTAVNSALEVDLFGQANLEWQEGQLIGGAGGAPDFASAARLSPDGQAITALPATAKRGVISRIVPQLSAPTASLTRTEIDTVVTEFGAASLRRMDMDERAAALIALAHPAHRSMLAAEWELIRRGV